MPDPTPVPPDAGGAEALAIAARNGDEAQVARLLAAGPAVDASAGDGGTPLWAACASAAAEADRLAVARRLLAAGADPNHRGPGGATPLHLAARGGPGDLVELLLVHGARTWLTDDGGRRPDALVAGSGLAPAEQRRITALLTTVQTGDPLLDRAVAALDRGDVAELEALLRTVPDLVRRRARGAEWFAGPYFTGPTLLHFIANNPQRRTPMPPRTLEALRTILDAGAVVDARTDGPGGSTTLGLVATCGSAAADGLQIPLIDLLAARGADPRLALDGAVFHGAWPAVAALRRHGAALTLVAAAGVGDGAALGELLPQAPDLERRRAAHAAAMHGRTACLEQLLAAGVPLDDPVPDHPYAPTLLHQAAGNGHAGTVELLLARGADRTRRDRQFHGTPADWARHLGQGAVAERLAAG